MGELDYQMALLLQHKFEQEFKSSRNLQKSDHELARLLQEEYQSEAVVETAPGGDQELARLLQEQFRQEATVDNPSSGLAYDAPKASTSKCLTDPSWELVDPTPDICSLFVAFNQRFFWNKLVAVCVSWSKRMTSCAGVCSYNGRGGMCSITLSEPLLKLRPRKDLVETLLHEMIHAYLFVTHNNRDRDGHGPEFHKHMYRINKESGTNITVYHSFHDEVRLYQQHWWRCNGPCQSRRPYFGMVRRATNRAPGPNDRWWADHSKNCGGTFIKVKEPEKTAKSSKKDETSQKNPDIRNYIPVVKAKSNGSNIKGFKDLNNKTRGVYNSSSTIVVTKTANSVKGGNSAVSGKSGSSSNIKGFKDLDDSPATKQVTKTKGSSNKTTDDFLTVRNHWQNKFGGSFNKRPPPSSQESQPKVPKFSKDFNYVACPVCGEEFLEAQLNDHLDVCLAQGDKAGETIDLTKSPDLRECPQCHEKVESSNYDVHVALCLMKAFEEIEGACEEIKKEKVPCLACGKEILKADLDSHLDECMVGIFDAKGGGDRADAGSQYNCPFCLKLVEEKEMKSHIDVCLNAADEDVVNLLTDDSF